MYQEIVGECSETLFRVTRTAHTFQVALASLLPLIVKQLQLVRKGLELGMCEDGVFDLLFFNSECNIFFPQRPKEVRAKCRGDIPVVLKCIDILLRNAAEQVCPDVLYVFGFLRIDIAGQIEVELIFMLDLVQRDHTAVPLYLKAVVEDIYDLAYVLCSQTVLVPVLHKVLAGIDHKDTLAAGGMLFVYDDDTRRDARTVEEVGRQPNDAFDISVTNKIAADLGFCTSTEKYTVRKNTRPFTRMFQRTDDVEQVGIVPLFGRRHSKIYKTLVLVVVGVDACAPALVTERRIGNYIVKCLQLPVVCLEERVGNGVSLFDDGGRIVVQDHIHMGKTCCCRVHLLSVECDFCSGFVRHLEQQ